MKRQLKTIVYMYLFINFLYSSEILNLKEILNNIEINNITKNYITESEESNVTKKLGKYSFKGNYFRIKFKRYIKNYNNDSVLLNFIDSTKSKIISKSTQFLPEEPYIIENNNVIFSFYNYRKGTLIEIIDTNVNKNTIEEKDKPKKEENKLIKNISKKIKFSFIKKDNSLLFKYLKNRISKKEKYIIYIEVNINRNNKNLSKGFKYVSSYIKDLKNELNKRFNNVKFIFINNGILHSKLNKNEDYFNVFVDDKIQFLKKEKYTIKNLNEFKTIYLSYFEDIINNEFINYEKTKKIDKIDNVTYAIFDKNFNGDYKNKFGIEYKYNKIFFKRNNFYYLLYSIKDFNMSSLIKIDLNTENGKKVKNFINYNRNKFNNSFMFCLLKDLKETKEINEITNKDIFTLSGEIKKYKCRSSLRY